MENSKELSLSLEELEEIKREFEKEKLFVEAELEVANKMIEKVKAKSIVETTDTNENITIENENVII